MLLHCNMLPRHAAMQVYAPAPTNAEAAFHRVVFVFISSKVVMDSVNILHPAPIQSNEIHLFTPTFALFCFVRSRTLISLRQVL